MTRYTDLVPVALLLLIAFSGRPVALLACELFACAADVPVATAYGNVNVTSCHHVGSTDGVPVLSAAVACSHAVAGGPAIWTKTTESRPVGSWLHRAGIEPAACDDWLPTGRTNPRLFLGAPPPGGRSRTLRI